jgi:hypothetical protein
MQAIRRTPLVLPLPTRLEQDIAVLRGALRALPSDSAPRTRWRRTLLTKLLADRCAEFERRAGDRASARTGRRAFA